MISNGMYFSTCKSHRINGGGAFYWCLFQDTGHCLEIFGPFESMEACLDDLSTNGAKAYQTWLAKGLK